jgi:hypothetical protein
VITPGTVVDGVVPDGMVFGQGAGRVLRPRFPHTAAEPAGAPTDTSE